MIICRDLETWSRPSAGLALAIGNFDGIHLGHQSLLANAVKRAKQHQGVPYVLTFDPHPLQVLAPHKKFTRLFDSEDQEQQLEKYGIQGIFLQNFNREFSELSAEDFLERFIFPDFRPVSLIVGYDFRFGKERRGDGAMLTEFCNRRKIDLQIVPAFKLGADIVSSSLIRKELEMANPERASELLGRPYQLRGVVSKGLQRGRLMGFPTANLTPTVDFAPAFGVYATRVSFPLRKKVFSSITNIGHNPTVGEDLRVKIETHIFDFKEDVYGESIEVELLHFVRKEQKFASFENLRQQIDQDCVRVRGMLK